MRSALFALLAAVLLAGTGCQHHSMFTADEGSCGPDGTACGARAVAPAAAVCYAPRSDVAPRLQGYEPVDVATPGPPSATVSYPYYTTRGPRDYFDPNPPSIGR